MPKQQLSAAWISNELDQPPVILAGQDCEWQTAPHAFEADRNSAQNVVQNLRRRTPKQYSPNFRYGIAA
jgi:hypothetical protein